MGPHILVRYAFSGIPGNKSNGIDSNAQDTICPLADRPPARWRGAHGPVQLPAGPPERRHVPRPHRGHRPRASPGRGRAEDRRRPALAGHLMGRGHRRRRPQRPVPPVASGSTSTASYATQAARGGQGLLRLRDRRGTGRRPQGGRGRQADLPLQAPGHAAHRGRRRQGPRGRPAGRGALPLPGQRRHRPRRGLRRCDHAGRASRTTSSSSRQDGFPTYHLANVVDDALMGVTYIMRGPGVPGSDLAARAACARPWALPSRATATCR